MTDYSHAMRPPGINPLWSRFQLEPPADWGRNCIGDLGSDSKGRLPRDLQDTPNDGDKPYLLIEGLLTGIPQGYTNEPGLPECVESDTVIVADGSRSGLALRGRCGVLGSTLLIYRAFLEVDNGFLYYIIESLYEFLNKAPTGGAIPHLDQDLLARLKVLTPPTREEQTRIAETLKVADDHIYAIEKQICKAELVKMALMQAAFPFERDSTGLPTIDNLIIAQIKNGYSPVCPDYETGKWVLGLDALTAHGFNPEGRKPAPNDDPKLLGNELQKNDILISRSNTRERVGYAGLYEGAPSPFA
jgi:restriction endonuclease S subunit